MPPTDPPLFGETHRVSCNSRDGKGAVVVVNPCLFLAIFANNLLLIVFTTLLANDETGDFLVWLMDFTMVAFMCFLVPVVITTRVVPAVPEALSCPVEPSKTSGPSGSNC